MSGSMSEMPQQQDIPPRRVAWHLRRVRRDFGYSRGQAARCLGVSPFRLWRWEHGSGMTPEQIDGVARAYGLEREALVPNRAPVRVDLDDRIIEVGDLQVRLRSDASDEVMSTYLRVIRTVRGLGAGSFMALREDDLVILADVLGHEPERIEERLIELMGLSQEEAAALRRVLLRKRVLAPAAGLVMGVSLLAGAAEPHLAGGDAVAETPVGAATAVEHDSWDSAADPTAEEGAAATVLPSGDAPPAADSAGVPGRTDRGPAPAAAPEQPGGEPAEIAQEVEVDEQPAPAAPVEQAPITPEPLLLGDTWEQPDDMEPTTPPDDDPSPEPVGKPDETPSFAGDGPPGLDGPDPDDLDGEGDDLADDPVEEDPVEEDPVEEDPVAEDPVAEDPVAEDPVAEDPVAEDPAAEGDGGASGNQGGGQGDGQGGVNGGGQGQGGGNQGKKLGHDK